MAIKRKSTTQLQRTKGLDYRCPNDDAWYSVRLLKVDDGCIRVMYIDFPEDFDEFYSHDKFKSSDEIDEILGRFRRPAEQLQDSQCGEVMPGMVVLACDTFSNGAILFFDATVDSVCRFVHKPHGTSDEQVCTCKFQVTWRHGLATGKHATVRAESICLIQDTPVNDPVLLEFIVSARKSLDNRTGNLADPEGNTGLTSPASSCGTYPHPADAPVLTDLKSPDSSHHNENVGQSHEVTKPQNKFGGVTSTELTSKGLKNGQKECVFFWVDNMDANIQPSKIVKFLKRELSVSSQVVLFPGLFLSNTFSGAIYVESKDHDVLPVLSFLKNPDNIIVSRNGRPWVFNKNCCGIYNFPMPYKDMNLDTENQDDVTEIRVLRPGSEGYEAARKMRSLFEAHYDHIDILKESMKAVELKLNNTLANGSRSQPSSSE